MASVIIQKHEIRVMRNLPSSPQNSLPSSKNLPPPKLTTKQYSPKLPSKQFSSMSLMNNTTKKKKARKLTSDEVSWTLDRRGPFHDWSYNGQNGPEFWQNSFPVAASEYQSPVNIDTKKVIYDSKLKGLLFDGYRDFRGGAKVKLRNNGCTVKLKLFDEATLTRGDLPDRYQAIHALFHWGSNNTRGSEHTSDGRPFPMEVQIVHRNMKYSEDEMYDKIDGLLVLAFWVEVNDTANEGFQYITEHLQKVRFKGQEAMIDQFPLLALLPEDTTVYYTYAGSLTTPPCNECVNWVVLSDTTKISRRQMDKFRQLYSSEDDTGEMLADNCRPVQKIYRRKIKVCMSLRDEDENE